MRFVTFKSNPSDSILQYLGMFVYLEANIPGFYIGELSAHVIHVAINKNAFRSDSDVVGVTL